MWYETPQGQLTLAQSSEVDTRTRATEAAVEIPFRIVDRHIMVDVTIDDTLEIEMILDTGMGFLRGAILLDPELGETLGLEYLTQIPLGGGGTEDPVSARVAVGSELSMPGVEFPGQQRAGGRGIGVQIRILRFLPSASAESQHAGDAQEAQRRRFGNVNVVHVKSP